MMQPSRANRITTGHRPEMENNTMTNTDRKQIIRNAIQEYKDAKQTGDTRKIEMAVNGIENAYICVCLHAVEGTEELRELILTARGYKEG